MLPGSPFGPNLRALVIYLRFTQGIAFERLAKLLSICSASTSAKARSSTYLTPRAEPSPRKPTRSVRVCCRERAGVGRDGFAGRQEKLVLWVFHHEDSAVFVARPTRAKTVVADFLGGVRPDFWVSDRYGGQMGWADKAQSGLPRPSHPRRAIRRRRRRQRASRRNYVPARARLPHRSTTAKARRRNIEEDLCRAAALPTSTISWRCQPAHEAGSKLQRVVKKIRRPMFVFRDQSPHSRDQ